MNLLFIVLGIGLIVFIITLQYRVCKKYLFDNAFTKINEKNNTITIKKQVITFSSIKNISIRNQDLNFAERFLVSTIFFAGVMEMIIHLKNDSQITVYLPKNYILNFGEKLKNNGVDIEYYDN